MFYYLLLVLLLFLQNQVLLKYYVDYSLEGILGQVMYTVKPQTRRSSSYDLTSTSQQIELSNFRWMGT